LRLGRVREARGIPLLATSIRPQGEYIKASEQLQEPIPQDEPQSWGRSAHGTTPVFQGSGWLLCAIDYCYRECSGSVKVSSRFDGPTVLAKILAPRNKSPVLIQWTTCLKAGLRRGLFWAMDYSKHRQR